MNAQFDHSVQSNFRLLINGQLVAGASTFDVVNPATEQLIVACPRADAAQLNAAVAAAKAAFPAWSATSIDERRKLLNKLADALAARIDEFAKLLTQEQGKPIAYARGEIAGAVDGIRVFTAMDLPVRLLKETESSRITEHRVPLGVVAAITPWNFPIAILANKVAPALLAGNTVVAKPAPTTPLTTLLFGEVCAAILPAGVLNIITDVNDLGSTLTSHPDIAKVTFTGSTATGKKVLASVADTLKRSTLELGGNDAAIVLDDVDIPEVARKVFFAAMFNTGQVCLAIKRVYAHDSIYDRFCSALATIADGAVVGNGLDPKTEFGPLQNRSQFEKVKSLIADARRKGTIVAGGQIPDGPGFFVRPTIVRDIADDARIVREEQFGPLLPVLRYSDVGEAIARANNSEYGLGGSVWSSDRNRAYEVATRIDSGTVWVNTHLDCPPDVAYGGAKQSGIGSELGQQGLEEFTQRKIVNVAL
ncbi:MAG: aldehyde dehydrogenase family protein [Steroidobacteraceae bacterium]